MFFWNVAVFYFSYLFSIDIDISEDHIHTLDIIVDRNPVYFFNCKYFAFYKQKKLEERLLECKHEI